MSYSSVEMSGIGIYHTVAELVYINIGNTKGCVGRKCSYNNKKASSFSSAGLNDMS